VHKRARYYDTATGEFTSPDPLEYVDCMSQYRAYFVPRTMDPFGTAALEDDSTEFDIDPWKVLGGTGWDYVLNPLSTATISTHGNLKGYVKTTATGECVNDSPVIKNEKHSLMGVTDGGVDITVYKIGYRLLWNVTVDSTQVIADVLVDTDKKGCQKRIKIYEHDIVFEAEWIFVFSEKRQIDMPNEISALTYTCCCAEK
jgi:hypothetical protein